MRASPRTSASAETDHGAISMPGTSLTQFRFGSVTGGDNVTRSFGGVPEDLRHGAAGDSLRAWKSKSGALTRPGRDRL